MLDTKSIFLSHSHHDKDPARQIYHELALDHIKVWIDEAEIGPGESIIAKIENAIDEMDYLGIILTPNSVTSPWVLTELRMALSDEIIGKKIRVIGLLMEDCELPGFLRDKKYIDFRLGFQHALAELARFLRDESPIVPVPRQAILASFVEQCDGALWDQIGGPRVSQLTLANVLRKLTSNELNFSLEVARKWRGYKTWQDSLVKAAERTVGADAPGARLLIRRLLELGFIEEAMDIDYSRKRNKAYCATPLLIALRELDEHLAG